MNRDRIILAVNVFDNGDTLREFVDWHLSLGVDFIVASDMGSTDGSQNILQDIASTQILSWSLQTRKNIDGFDPLSELARTARDRFEADWILLADADEFLCVGDANLRELLHDAKNRDVSVLSVPRFNMTGPIPAPGTNGLKTLTLRINRSCDLHHDLRISGYLPYPQVFAPIGPKTIVRADRFIAYGSGGHSASVSTGQVGICAELSMLHYPFRSFHTFARKAENIATWMAANPHLPPEWGWHWRRYIRLLEANQLVEEYERQFVSPAQALELVRDRTCTVDQTIARWLERSRLT